MADTLPNLQMARGDTRTIKITATYPAAIPEQNIAAGDPFPLNDKTVYFTARLKQFAAPDTQIAFAKRTGGQGITVRSSPNNHIADVAIATADTEGYAASTNLAADCRTKDGSGNLWTVWRGTITIGANATRTTT